jgi:hypothetical protein
MPYGEKNVGINELITDLHISDYAQSLTKKMVAVKGKGLKVKIIF